MYKNKSYSSYSYKKAIIENILTVFVVIVLAFCLIIVPFTIWHDDTNNGNMTAPYVKVYSGFDYDIVYDKETMVMYSISTATDSRGVATVMLNADGTPKLWDGETSETN